MVVAYVEETIPFQTERLMYLEIETDGFHGVYVCFRLILFRLCFCV